MSRLASQQQEEGVSVSDDSDLSFTRRKPRELRESNPAPRPAVRVNIVPPRTHAGRPSSRSHKIDDFSEDEGDALRPMRDLEPRSSRPIGLHETSRFTADAQGVNSPRGSSRNARPNAGLSLQEMDALTLTRYVAAGLAAIFLITVIALGVSNRSLRGRLNDATYELENMSSAQSPDMITMQFQLDERNARIAYLENQIDDLLDGQEANPGPGTTPPEQPGPGSGPGPIEDDTPPPPQPPQATRTHTVQPGETLSGIAYRFFGNSHPDTRNAIAAANGIDNPDRIGIGTELIIPNIPS